MAGLSLTFLIAIIGTKIIVTGARPLSTKDEGKIAAVCSSPHLECARNTPTDKDTGISRDHRFTQTIDAFQRDFSRKPVLDEENTMALDSNLTDSTSERDLLQSSAATTTLEHLGVAPDSDMAMAIVTAAYLCGYGTLPGENMACAAPDEAMAAFVSNKLACAPL